MKYWLSHLPLEVWVDCYRYPGITREELGRIVDRFRNHKFAEYLQFYLHDWGRRKLKQVSFDQTFCPSRLRPGIPQTPMPANIRSFERIAIRQFDAQAVAFLHQIGPILTNVQLQLCNISNMATLRIILANLLPLLNGGIHSLFTNVRALPTVRQCFGNEGLARLKQLAIFQGQGDWRGEAAVQATVNFLMDCLALLEGNGDDDGPRLFEAVMNDNDAFCRQISSAIREQFLVAKTPCTFALIIRLAWQPNFVEFHLENGIGEQLHVVKIEQAAHIQIIRHRAGCGQELLEWIQQNGAANSHRGRIDIIDPAIGLLDDAMVLRNVGEEENQQQSAPIIQIERGLMNWNYIFPLAMDVIKHLFI